MHARGEGDDCFTQGEKDAGVRTSKNLFLFFLVFFVFFLVFFFVFFLFFFVFFLFVFNHHV